MDDQLPTFEKAVNDFRVFLRNQGHSDRIVWVFRDDTWFKAIDALVMRFPVSPNNEELTRKVYSEAKIKGLASISALATFRDKIVATVWFPKFEDQEVQGWDRGLKLSILIPLPEAKDVSPLLWSFVSILPSYRRFFRESNWLIGSKQWALAERLTRKSR